eukprot:5884466-Lingulodinium_polyedra.AAC.1
MTSQPCSNSPVCDSHYLQSTATMLADRRPCFAFPPLAVGYPCSRQDACTIGTNGGSSYGTAL